MTAALHQPVLVDFPGRAQAVFYCDGARMTPEAVQAFAARIEAVTGRELTHVIRNAFPVRRTASIAEETQQRWLREPRVRLSNGGRAEDSLELVVGRLPRALAQGRTFYGSATLLYAPESAVATALAAGFAQLVDAFEAGFARLDLRGGVRHPAVRVQLAGDWLLQERRGDLTHPPAD